MRRRCLTWLSWWLQLVVHPKQVVEPVNDKTSLWSPTLWICRVYGRFNSQGETMEVSSVGPFIKKACDESAVLLVECRPTDRDVFTPSYKGARTNSTFASELRDRHVAFRNPEGRGQVSVGCFTSVEKDKPIRPPVGAFQRVGRVFQEFVQVRNVDLLACVVNIPHPLRAAVAEIVEISRAKIVG